MVRPLLAWAGLFLATTGLTFLALLLWNDGASTNFVPFRYLFF